MCAAIGVQDSTVKALVTDLVPPRPPALIPLWRPNNPTDMAFLSGLLEAGSITPIVDQVLPLAQAAQALTRFGASGHVGKIVLTME